MAHQQELPWCQHGTRETPEKRGQLVISSARGSLLNYPLVKGSVSFQSFKGFVSPKDSEAVHGRPPQRETET